MRLSILCRHICSSRTRMGNPCVRWRQALRRMKVRYRDPYNARHSSVSWIPMLGKNLLWVAKNHGHSVTTMLQVYAAWTNGAGDADVAAIKQALESAAHGPAGRQSTGSPLSTPEFPEFASYLPVSDQVLHPETRAIRGVHIGNIWRREGLLALRASPVRSRPWNVGSTAGAERRATRM